MERLVLTGAIDITSSLRVSDSDHALLVRLLDEPCSRRQSAAAETA